MEKCFPPSYEDKYMHTLTVNTMYIKSFDVMQIRIV